MEVTFLPRKQYVATVLPYPNGKKGVYTEQTDSIQANLPLSDFISMVEARNLRVGAFIGRHAHDNSKNELIRQLSDSGILRCGYYFPPKSTTVSSEVYTQAEFDALLAANNAWFKSILNFNPTTLSYGYGNTNYSDMASSYFLGGRNSGIEANNTQFDTNYIRRASTSRWWYSTSSGSVTVDQAIATVEQSITNIITNGGWHNNFTHWHSVYAATGDRGIASYVKYLDMLSKYTNDLYFCSYSEACEYIWLKKNIKDIALYKPINEYCIRLVIARISAIPEDFCARESIEVDLSGTILAGKTIRIDSGNVISKSGDKYIINADKSNIITFTSGTI